MTKFIKSITHAIEGLGWALREHANFRIHLVLGLMALLLAMRLGFSLLEYAILILTIAMVVVAEVLNTALEEISDLITMRWSKHSKIAKDVGAGAVLVASFVALIVGLLLFIPKIF